MYRLNAGAKIHCYKVIAKNVGGKVLIKRAKVMIAGEIIDQDGTMCGTDHSAEEFKFFASARRQRPESVCKHCEKKLFEIAKRAGWKGEAA